MKNLGSFLAVVTISIIFILVLALPLMWLWNWLMPLIFGLIKINFIQAVGLNTLVGILFIKPTK